jgi:hypothetical protein
MHPVTKLTESYLAEPTHYQTSAVYDCGALHVPILETKSYIIIIRPYVKYLTVPEHTNYT